MSALRMLVLYKALDPPAQGWVDWLSLHADVTPVPIKGTGAPECRARLRRWDGDVLWSYRCPWIVPQILLSRARLAVNFHPGTPDYPGIGATNFALYEGATRYGAMCHHMIAAVDQGVVIAVRPFPLYPTDTVLSLTRHTHAVMLGLAYEMADRVLRGAPLPVSRWQWSRPPFRRADLNGLCDTTPEMSDAEVARRVRATRYPGFPGAAPREGTCSSLICSG